MQNFTDEKLFSLCKYYGSQALMWRQKFCGLLPEVNRRKLYEKKGFGSIFEFAKKLAGLSEEQVRLTLNLEKRLEEMPKLKELLVTGAVSVNKLARVVSIAAPENEDFLANQVQILSRTALETLVRDEKQNGFPQPQIHDKSLHVQTSNTLQLSCEITQRLLELQQKGIDINALLKELLDKREQEIAEEKLEIAAEIEQTDSRYIPQKIQKMIKKEHGEKCSIDTCDKPSETLHHTRRFAITKNHDPHFLAPLCQNHHAIAHSIDVHVQEMKRYSISSPSASHPKKLFSKSSCGEAASQQQRHQQGQPEFSQEFRE